MATRINKESKLFSFSNISSCLADDGSDLSSGRDTPASNSSRQGAGDRTEEKGKKDKKKKSKTKKKEKNKGKGKEKDKKKAEEPEETEKKSKKIGFGLLRWVVVIQLENWQRFDVKTHALYILVFFCFTV